MEKKYKNIVIFAQNRNFFGAQIVHIPMIKLIRKNFKNSNITVFSKHKISYLLKDLNLIDNLIIEKNKLQTIKEFYKKNPDITISLREKSTFLNFLIFLFSRKIKIGFKNFLNDIFFTKTYFSDKNIYRAKNYEKLLIKTLNLKSNINENNNIKDRVVLIPGAGNDYKIWAIENFLKLADLINEEVIFVIGEKEKQFINKINSYKNRYKILYNKDIKTLFDLIQSSKIVIANDCGPSHIAQISQNVNNIILYSDEYNNSKEIIKEWFNRKKNSYYLVSERGTSINNIKVNDVYKLYKKIMKKG